MFEKERARLVEELIRGGDLKDRRLMLAFQNVLLEKFIPSNLLDKTTLYRDKPSTFFQKGQTVRTISAPSMICVMLQGLGLESDDNLLILGAKSGYIEVLASYMTTDGEIFILEANEDVANLTKKNLESTGCDERISVYHGSPLEGLPDLAPWQIIMVTGAISKDILNKLLWQLDENGGFLLAPVGAGDRQEFLQIIRNGNKFYSKPCCESAVIFSSLETKILYAESSAAKKEIQKILTERLQHKIGEKMKTPQITQDISRVENELKSKIERYESQREGEISDEEIEETAVNEANRTGGVAKLIRIAESLDVSIEQVIQTLSESNKGTLQDLGPDSVQDKVFIVQRADTQELEKVKENLEEILKIVKDLKYEKSCQVKIEAMKTIDSIIEYLAEIKESYGMKVKKINATIRELHAVIMILSDLEGLIQTDGTVINQKMPLIQKESELAETITGAIKEELKKFENVI